LEEKKPFPALSDPAPWAAPSARTDNAAVPPLFEPSARSAAILPSSFNTELMQVEIAPRMRFMLAFFGRVDFPGSGDVTVDGDQYGDIFDIGYGLNVEGSVVSWVTPQWGIGGYLSIGRDRYEGTSHLPLLSGEVFSFDTMDEVS